MEDIVQDHDRGILDPSSQLNKTLLSLCRVSLPLERQPFWQYNWEEICQAWTLCVILKDTV